MDYTITSDLAEVRKATDTLRSYCEQLDIQPEMLAELELIMSEALNNVILHAYDSCPGLPISISIAAQDGWLKIKIKDYGKQMPCSRLRPPPMPELNIDNLPEGGWGLCLIHRLADTISYARKDKGNTLTIKKNTCS